LATPVIHNQKVYGLSATGRLFCLELNSGNQVWARELKEDEKAPQPMYGFTTSPIVAGGNLIVQIGAKDKAIAGFDLDTGATNWAVGNDRINSQTPLATKVAGKETVLAVGGGKLTGVDPSDGRIVFEYEHQGGNAGAVTPVPIGENTVLLTLDDSFSKAVSLQPTGTKINVSEEWQNRSIKNTYNIPVLIGGNVYAFSTRILTCVDPKTGRPSWKSRAPGDGFLISIDDHLIVSTKKGGLHIAKASPKKYSEIAGAKIFDDLVWSVPAYHDNSIFMRSLGEVARVDIVNKKSTVAVGERAAMPVGATFARFLDFVEAADSNEAKATAVDRFLKSRESFPIIEGEIVHFVYRGDEKDVALASDMFGARQEKKMTKVEGTDLFYYAMKMPDDQRANYVFLADYQPKLDPLNKRKTTSSVYAGEMEFAMRLQGQPRLQMSWFAMPDWKQPEYFPLPEKMAGSVNEHVIDDDEEKKTKFKFEVYTPPGYDKDSDRRYSVAYIFGGTAARQQGKIAEIADSIFQKQKAAGKQLAPECILVFVTTNPMAPPDPKLISEKVVPFVDKTYKTIDDRAGRLCVGFGFDSASALGALVANPELFGGISLQSPLIFDAMREMAVPALAKIDKPTNLRLEWGRFDMFNPHENWDLRTMTQSFADEIAKNKTLNVDAKMVNDSTDWISWQNRVDEILRMLDSKKE
jgi:enterochelin esterase-like enzyme